MLRSFTRKLRICLVCALTLLAFSGAAQNFNFSSSTGTFTAVNGTAVASILGDDQLSGNLPIGFTFNYYGTNYTELKASSNGFLTFDLASTTSAASNAFYGSQTKLIAPLWDDLGGTGGTATYSTTGSVGSRVFTFEWINWKWDYQASSAVISFQVKLYETTNVIQFIYKQEAGAVTSADASIGLVGNTSDQFYSLNNTSAVPGFSLSGNTTLASKPSNNQVYTFTPAAALTAPTTPASAIVISGNTGSDMNVAWTNGNGSNRAVFIKNTSTAEDLVVTDGSASGVSTIFGTSSALYSSGWYCVYNGTGNSVTVSGLEFGLPYRIKVVEYNGIGGAQKYVNTAATNNPVGVTALLVRPTGSSIVSINRVSATEVSLDIDESSAIRRAVFIKAGATTGNAPVVDNTTYIANTAMGLGTQIGNTGWFCVFNGKSSGPFVVTGLAGNTDYRVNVVDYNGPASSELYSSAAVSSNAKNFRTYNTLPALPTYTFAASSGTFTPLAGGTVVPRSGGNIHGDDLLSSGMPIGFTFKFAGVPFTQLYASSNGFISFNSFDIYSDNSNSLTNSTVRPAIAPFWDDLGGSFGAATYATTGVAPNRVFTIEYLNWAANYTAPSAVLSFQVKLYETTNKIEFIYRKEAGTPTGVSASIGLAFPNTGTNNFMSLNGAGAAPTASTTSETTNINAVPATGQVYSFTPVKLNQTITFPAIADKFFGTGTFALTATSNSGLPITYSSSNTNIATIQGSTLTMTGVGSVTITASQAGDDVFNAAVDAQRAFIVNKGNQVINFSSLLQKQYGNAPFNLTATSSSNLAVGYTSSNTSVATVSGSTVTIVGVGTTDITASQGGDANYNAATNVVQTLTVGKGTQTITINPIADKRYLDAPFTVEGTSTTGGPLTFTSSNTAVATVSGNTVTIVGAGSTTITATQAGNDLYNLGTGTRNLTVSKAEPVITFQEIPAKAVGDAPFTIVATSSTGQSLRFSASSNVELNGNVVTIKENGSTSLNAHEDGNNNYFSKTVTKVICISPPKPVIKVLNIDSQIPTLEAPSGRWGYRWFKDGVQVEGANIYNVTAPGVYTLVTHLDGCESVPSDGVSLIITGTEETTDAGVKIYPNPVVNELIVDVTSLHEKTPVLVELHDVSGRTIHSELASKKAIVKMEKQQPGLYLLKIKGSKKVITKQIIKK
jgi:hypothetical protein